MFDCCGPRKDSPRQLEATTVLNTVWKPAVYCEENTENAEVEPQSKTPVFQTSIQTKAEVQFEYTATVTMATMTFILAFLLFSWSRHGSQVNTVGVVALGLAAVLIWLFTKPNCEKAP